MSFTPSEFPGGHERHCLLRISHAELFEAASGTPEKSLADAIAKDTVNAKVFATDFEAVLERAVALKPSEETEVVLAVKAELDRLYTVSVSLGGDQSKIREALARLIDLTMQSVRRAAGTDALAIKELQEESDARRLHFKQLECSLLADLLNSDNEANALVPTGELIPSLLSSDKAILADVITLFDMRQLTDIILNGKQLLATLQENPNVSLGSVVITEATQNLEFIKGYKVYLEDYG